MDKTVGIIGLGIMGGAIARNLVERGWRVIGFDIDAAKCAELAAEQVVIVENVAQLVHNAPIVMTSLPTPAAVESVAKAIADTREPPRIVVELSTLTLADKLRFEATLKKAGHIPLDCPLSGTGAQAKMRDLIVYASGDSEAIAKCGQLFADFAKQSADLGPKRVVEMVGPGAGGSRMFQMRAPMMVEREYEPATMKGSTWKKDMAIIAEFAEDIGVKTPLFTLTQPVYTEAMTMGLGDQDTACVFEVLQRTIVTDPKSGGAKERH